MNHFRTTAVLLSLSVLCALGCGGNDDVVRVGSKDFNESQILGEVVLQYARSQDVDAEHLPRLGGSPVVWNALQSGEIDVYPDYTGTLRLELMKQEKLRTDAELDAALAKRGLRMTKSLGFDNSYEIGIRNTLHPTAKSRFGTDDIDGIRKISDLARFPNLKLGFGNEFIERGDGWRQLKLFYGLPQDEVDGLEHDFAYRGLDSGSIDVTDIYSTDAKIRVHDIRVLEDDRGFFPAYEAVLVYRADLEERAPEFVKLLQALEGRIDVETMTSMNASAMLDHEPHAVVAAGFLNETFGLSLDPRVATFWENLGRHTSRHLLLVGTSLVLAIIVAVPLGILAVKWHRMGQLLIGTVGILQTIPSLALFVVLIPLLGLGPPPAIFALFLYSLLPIVRNTHAGLVQIPKTMHESAEAIGLPPATRLRWIELPLAARSILAGIKTAAVINVGTATLGGFIGAGGYGDPIFAGLRQERADLMLQGAIPAALMALCAQGFFELCERVIVPRGLRLKPNE